jgi:hypothetical protein
MEHNLFEDKSRIPENLKTEVARGMTMQLQKMSEQQALDRVSKARFSKDLTPIERTLLAQVAREYGLDPVMGELMIYQGNPYVTIWGRVRKAQETEQLDGMGGAPATEEERKARHAKEGDILYHYNAYKKGCTHPFEGWGRVTQEEIDKNIRAAETNGHDPNSLPIVKDPDNIAEKRAKALALKNGFHLPIPSWEDVEGTFMGDKRYDLESTARDLGTETTDLGSCPVHHKPFREGTYGPYCPTKVDGKWCKEKPVKKAATVEPGQTSEEPVFTDEELGEAVPPKQEPVKTTAKESPKLVVGSDAWLMMMVAKLNIPDAAIVDEVLLKRYSFNPNKIDPVIGNNFKNLTDENRADFAKLLSTKEKAGKQA